jgi:preprotein translocase subunit Sec61beta
MPASFVNQFEDSESGKVKLNPMTPLAASSTVINLLLATGPFSYPYSYVNAGPIFSCTIIAITSFLAYVSATFMIEAISISQTIDPNNPEGLVMEEDQDQGRSESVDTVFG